MKGIGIIVFMFLIMAALVGFTTALSIIKGSTSASAFAENPYQIIIDALLHFPTAEFYDLFFGGTFGVLKWLNGYVIVPFLSMPFVNRLPNFLGYLIIGLIMSIVLWRKKEGIYDFVTRYTIYAIMILSLVFMAGVILKFLNLI